MTAISPTNGPIAVTGASGYIGSWIVQDLMEQGYAVRASVRDAGRPDKVDHLLAMKDAGLAGQLELARAEGIFPAPEGGARVAAAALLAESGFFKENDRVVLFNTGTGLKYPDVPWLQGS